MLGGLPVRRASMPFGLLAWRVVWIDDAVVVAEVLARALDAYEQGLALGDGDAHRMLSIAGVVRFEGAVAGDGYNPYASVRAEGEWWLVLVGCAWLRVSLLVIISKRYR